MLNWKAEYISPFVMALDLLTARQRARKFGWTADPKIELRSETTPTRIEITFLPRKINSKNRGYLIGPSETGVSVATSTMHDFTEILDDDDAG